MSQSPAIKPKEVVNPRSTRQLLDELDDLMNQMLSLPVEDEPKDPAPPNAAPAVSATLTMIEPEEPDADPEPSAPAFTLLPLPRYSGEEGRGEGASIPREGSAPPPTTTFANSYEAKSPVVSHEDAALLPDATSPSPPTPFPGNAGTEETPIAVAPEPVRSIPIRRPSPDPADEEIVISDDMLVEEPQPPFVPFRRESRPMPRSNASWLVRTLVVWDRGFRRFTRWLGPFGWAMRSSFGRMLLGLCGLACWGVALAWLIKDWMQWPQ